MPEHKGWHSRGYLPHFDSPDTVQFVTFRLADSLPRTVVQALGQEDSAVLLIDCELDNGLGACWLGRPDVADLVQSAILHFDNTRYRILAWCIMPNHVHVVLEPFDGQRLGAILHSWKSFTANKANLLVGRAGAFWHDDYFGRYMRDERHLAQTIHYVEQNPVKARLVDAAERWVWSSARYRERL
jgi:REP element-mobilizing transposase RayT